MVETAIPATDNLPPQYQLIGFVIVGNELKATVRTPSGDVYQGVVGSWRKVMAIEVPK